MSSDTAETCQRALSLLPVLRSQLLSPPLDPAHIRPIEALKAELDCIEAQLVCTAVSEPSAKALVQTSVMAWSLVPNLYCPELWNAGFLCDTLKAWNRQEKYYDLLLFLENLLVLDSEKIWTETLDAIIGIVATEYINEGKTCFLANSDQLHEFLFIPFITSLRDTKLFRRNPPNSQLSATLDTACNEAISTACSQDKCYLYEVSCFKKGLLHLVLHSYGTALTIFDSVLSNIKTNLIYALAVYCVGVLSGLSLTSRPAVPAEVEETALCFCLAAEVGKEMQNLWVSGKAEYLAAFYQYEFGGKEMEIQRIEAIRGSFETLQFAELQCAYITYCLANYQYRGQNYQAAISLLLPLIEGFPTLPLIGNIYSLLLCCEAALGNRDIAESHCEQALLQLQAFPGSFLNKSSLLSISDQCFLLKDYAQALDLNSQAFLTELQRENTEEMWFILLRRAKMLKKLKKTQEVVKLCKLVVKAEDRKEQHWTKAKADALRFLAYSYWKTERNFEAAEICYIECIAIRKASGQREKLMKAYLSLAVMYSRWKVKPKATALALFEKAHAICEELYGESIWLFTINREISGLFAGAKDWERAYEYSMRAKQFEHLVEDKEVKEKFRQNLVAMLFKLNKPLEAQQLAESQVLDDFSLVRIRPSRKMDSDI